MNRHPPRDITEQEISTYEDRGVVCLRGVLDPDWIERMRTAMDRVLEKPGPQGIDLQPQDAEGRFYFETNMWFYDDDFRAIMMDSPLAQLAAQVMRSERIHILFDFMFAKEPQSPFPTDWHQDLSANPVEGWQVCGSWAPLDSVTHDSGALEYIVGSHRWGRRFGSPQNTDDREHKQGEQGVGYFKGPQGETISVVDDDLSEFEPQPDFEKIRDRFEIASFDTEPGDVVFNHVLVLHGAPGNRTQRRRRAFAHRWVGDDTTYAIRRSKNRLYPPRDPGLKHGDPFPPDGDVFPQAWPRRKHAGRTQAAE